MILSPLDIKAAGALVMIDPGHGGFDRGAVYDNAKESQIVLSLAGKLTNELNSRKNFKALLTRESDRHLNLATRVKNAEQAKAQLFISLHANAAPESSAKGFEFFVFNPSNYRRANLGKLSEREAVVKTIITDLQQQTRFFQSIQTSEEFSKTFQGPLKAGDFFVLRKATIPAILLEVGFLSNPRDRARLQKSEYQDEMAIKMADSIESAAARLGLQIPIEKQRTAATE